MKNTFSFFKEEILEKKLNSPLGYILLFLISLVFIFIIKYFGEIGGYISLVLLICTPLALICLVNPAFGYIIALVYAFFMFLIYRLIDGIPFGIFYDIIFCILLLGVLLKQLSKERTDWKDLKNPIFLMLYIWSGYLILQILNPNAVSMGAYLYGIRGLLIKFCILIVGLYVVKSYSFVKRFTKVWVGLAILAALYSLKQEHIGFFDFERNWIFAEESRFKLVFIWGRFRKWSFLSDVNAFGLLMAFTSIFCIILALGPYSKTVKIALFGSTILSLMGMTFSGTRTAYAMVPAGLSLYFVMTLNNPKTIIYGVIGVAAIGLLIFGPFYGGNLNRLRSLTDTDDPSLQVRNINRERIQPYIQSHPIGGGLITTGVSGAKYSPGHPLAGFPPDSGYLETALETGWIGLIFEMMFLATVIIIGVKNYFRSRNPFIKNLYCAYICSLFALTIANYAQSSLGQKPIGLLVYTTYILMFRLYEFDKSIKENSY